jgi:hypothetical protein
MSGRGLVTMEVLCRADPDVPVKCTRFVTLWNRYPPHDWVVLR